MKSAVIVSGDIVKFIPLFGTRMIQVPYTTIPGSGHVSIGPKKVCVKGDEKKVILITPYIRGQYTIPGIAKVTIKKLDSGQLASDCISPKALITQGQKPCMFKAQLKVLTPAMMPPPASTPDKLPDNNLLDPAISDGEGMFNASQFWVEAG